MENTESLQTKNGHDVSIALIQKDIGYIRESLTKIDTTMAVYDRNFARKEEMTLITNAIKGISDKIEKKADHADIRNLVTLIDKKVDVNDFEPIKTALSRINWMLIAAIIAALLALVVKAGS